MRVSVNMNTDGVVRYPARTVLIKYVQNGYVITVTTHEVDTETFIAPTQEAMISIVTDAFQTIKAKRV